MRIGLPIWRTNGDSQVERQHTQGSRPPLRASKSPVRQRLCSDGTPKRLSPTRLLCSEKHAKKRLFLVEWMAAQLARRKTRLEDALSLERQKTQLRWSQMTYG